MGAIEDVDAIRRLRGQTQEALIDELRGLGAPERSQASMSRYLTGQQAASEDVLAAMGKYVDRHRGVLGDAASAAADHGQVVHLHSRTALSRSSTSGDEDARQAVLERVRTGPPLSKWDYEALVRFARVPEGPADEPTVGSGT